MNTTETNDTEIVEMMQTLMNEGLQGFPAVMTRMYEVCDVLDGEPYTPIAVFDCVDDVWKYIVAEGHRVRNWKSWLLTTIDAYQQHREIEECLARWSTKLGENLQSGGV